MQILSIGNGEKHQKMALREASVIESLLARELPGADADCKPAEKGSIPSLASKKPIQIITNIFTEHCPVYDMGSCTYEVQQYRRNTPLGKVLEQACIMSFENGELEEKVQKLTERAKELGIENAKMKRKIKELERKLCQS